MRGQERVRPTEEQTRSKETRKRVPVGGPRDVLTVHGKDPNYEYRFVNDQNNRIQRFIHGGWEIVTEEMGDYEIGAPRVGVPSGEGSPIKVSVGGAVQAYLMRILKELYEADQKQKQEYVDELERQIKDGPKKEGMYGDVELRK
jgi:hypothetical protein